MQRWLFTAFFCLTPWAVAQAATVLEVASAQSPAFGSALEASGLAPMLKGGGTYTVFVPSSAAFAKLDEKLMKDPERLKAVMAYHIVPSKVTPSELKQMVAAKTVNGKELKVSSKGPFIEVGKAKVAQGEISASNGLVYSIDAVLMP